MPVTLAPGVSLRPGSSAENIVQPVVDATNLILRPFSNAQSSPVFQVQNVDGSAVHFGVNPAGDIQLAGGVGTSGQVLTSGGAGAATSWVSVPVSDFSTVAILAPNSPTRNTIQPTADANSGLEIWQHSATQSNPLLRWADHTGVTTLGEITPAGGVGVGANPTGALNWFNGAGTFSTPTLAAGMSGAAGTGVSFQAFDQNGLIQLSCGGTTPTPGFASVAVFANADDQVAFYSMRSSPTQSADIQRVLSDDGTTVLMGNAGPDGHLYFGQRTSDFSAAKLTEFPFEFVNNVAATFTARQRMLVYDFGGAREIWRGESNGTVPMVGFLGATAIVRPASTADLRQALISLGLYTAGGASPLNLNGGVLTASGSGNSLGASTFTGDLTLSTHNLITDGMTGSQIGTAPTQKIGLWGQTPVVQPGPYTVTNATPNRNLNEASVTLTQLAQVVGTLVQDLQSYGAVG